ncbi:MAG: alcohol dehydrogenase catalytic domain-containing protein [Chloroflexota bacterium]|nr:alcohol dehydrogenase catalytic domain-containing protein [Chloroflexota bacterium]
MKSIQYFGIDDLRLVESPKPRPKENECLLRIVSVGICGSDIHYLRDGGTGDVQLDQPMILGHEFSAIVETGPLQGQLAAVDPALSCGTCEYCLEGKPNFCNNMRFAGAEGVDGALQEFLAWPEEAVFPLPASFSPQEGALLEPLGVAIHALRLGHVFPGMDVGVFGAGPIGLLTIQLAKLAGAARIFATDKLSHRLEIACKCGATDILLANGDEAEKILSATNGRGLDITFEAAGDDGTAVESAVLASKRGATVVVIGIPSVDETRFTASASRRRGLTIKISRRMINTYPTAIRMVSSRMVDLSTLITHQFPLEDYMKAFTAAANRLGGKVFINFIS